MYNTIWDIKIGKYKLLMVEEVEIHSSVDLLADSATINLPATNLNKRLDVESKIKIGDPVTIAFGYQPDLITEFEGYVQRISTDDGSIELHCEDGIYLTRKAIDDKVFTNATVSDIINYIANQIGGISVNCDVTIGYDSFVISRATGYDVLDKIQEDTKANIYMKGKELNVHYPYVERLGDVTYDFQRNVEKSDLTYKRAEQRKFQVEVESIGKDGKRIVETVGTTGGDKRTKKVYGITSREALKKIGENELSKLVYDGYEGSLTGWLRPILTPGYSAKVKDPDYPEKEGSYYVVAVTTSISSSGGVRKVQLGRRLN